MKKLILCLMLCILLTGCGKSADEEELALIKMYGEDHVFRCDEIGNAFLVVSGEVVEFRFIWYGVGSNSVRSYDVSEFIGEKYKVYDKETKQ